MYLVKTPGLNCYLIITKHNIIYKSLQVTYNHKRAKQCVDICYNTRGPM